MTDSSERFLRITTFLSQFKFEIEAAFTIIMADLVASDIVIFIETCVFYEGELDRFSRTISENHYFFIAIQV